MRERLVAALVGLTLAVLLLFGVPRAFFLHDFVEANARDGAERSVGYAAAVVDRAVAEGLPVGPQLFDGADVPDETVVHVGPDGVTTVLHGDGSVSDERLSASRRTADGGTVTVAIAEDVVSEQYQAALLPLVLLGLTLVPAAGLLGLLLARRLSRPFTELADVAQRMGSGRLDLDVQHYRMPEAQAIGSALAHSAVRLETMLRREREVAAHASHELRTPITAVRLTLEDLALWPQTDPLVADELHRVVAEVDRLSLAVSGLLEESRSVRMSGVEPVDLGAVVSESLDRWDPVAEAVGLSLRRTPAPDELRVELPLHTVTQAVDLLLQHACEVADADVTVCWEDRSTHFAVEVGYSVAGSDAHESEACTEAAELAASVGGRLAVDTGPEPGSPGSTGSTGVPGGDRSVRDDRRAVRLVLMLPTSRA